MRTKSTAITLFILLINIILTACSLNSPTIDLENIVYSDNNTFTCTFDGTEHDVILDFPSDTNNAPLIIMLHGYGNTAESFRLEVGIEDEANQKGYFVAYVTGSKDKSNQTSSTEWNSGLGASSNKDVEFLVALVKYLENEYSLNTNRTYAVGFSNGAFMTHRLAVEGSNTFEAIVSVAGFMPDSVWQQRPENLKMSVLQITGTRDDVVPQELNGSSNYSPNPSIESVIDYYVVANGLTDSKTELLGDSELSICFSQEGNAQVWHLVVNEGRHSWPTEAASGIDANSLILEFLENL